MRRFVPPRGRASRADVPFLNRMWVRLAIASTVLAILVISFTAGFILRLAAEELRRNLTQRNEQIARRAAEEISTFIDGARSTLTDSADTLQFLDRVPWVSEVLLENKVMAHSLFDTVVAVDAKGTDLADSSLTRVDMSRFSPEAMEMAKAGTAWTSPVEIDPHGLPRMTFVLPAGNGISLIAQLSLESIWHVMDDIDAGSGGFAFLVSSDGTLIAHPDKTRVLRRESAFAVGASAPRNVLLVSSPVLGLGWTVYIQQPLAEAFFPVALLLRRSYILLLGGLAMAVCLGIIFARLYSRSMDALLWGTMRIAERDLAYQIPSHSNDEFGVLSRSFNDMVMGLRERSQALEDSERRYRQVTESVRDIIFSLDGEGRFVFLNSYAGHSLGYPLNQLLGKRLQEILTPESRKKVDENPRSLYARPLPREVTALTRTGEELILELEGVRIPALGGEVEIHGIARDITQRKRMEEKLRRSEKLSALGEIVSKVAHELRNAVGGITASMEMARARGRADAALGVDLDRVLSEALRAQGIVQALLGSSSERGINRAPCSLNDAAASVVALRQARLGAAGIQVALDLAPGLPPVIADADKLRQVFHNLVDNAQNALLRQTGERALRIRSWAGERKVSVEISDSGTGIAPNDLGRIFDPFYTTRRDDGGTGLGLAVSLAIVEGFGGDITVRSEPGRGAAFIVELPEAPNAGRASAQGQLPTVLRPRGLSRGDKRILVAEDEPMLLEFVRNYMQNDGWAVDSVSNGRQAMAMLAAGTSYALVISDFRMPDGDGRDLYEWIRASRPSLLKRLIYITGDSLNHDTMAFFGETGAEFLLKPIVASLLGEKVRRILDAADFTADSRPS
jgi:PAS domain S-box-containing protein